jgi:GTP-binding protein Era
VDTNPDQTTGHDDGASSDRSAHGRGATGGENRGEGSFRSGFVAVVGRPNVGKSTLVNQILGTKVTITSRRPNTTRRSVRGVLHRPGVQVVLVDTPGLHRPRSALGRRLNEQVVEVLYDLDVVVAMLDATASLGPGDRLVLERAAASCASGSNRERDLRRLLVVVNKVDRATSAEVLAQLSAAHEVLEGVKNVGTLDVSGMNDEVLRHGVSHEDGLEREQDRGVEYFAVSARSGRGVDELLEAVLERLPEGPRYFPDDMVSDVPEAFWVAELVREQLLARVRDELPHSIACRVSEWEWPRVRVEIVVERESQKGIVIGRGGEVLKAVGTAVREQLPPGAFVELYVCVEKHWQENPEAIERFGY